MKVLAIQPFLKGYGIHPWAGGKDKAALEISRVLVAAGHRLDVLPLPWGLEAHNTEWVAQAQPFLLAPDGEQARVLPTLTMPTAAEARRLLWRFLTGKRTLGEPYATARDLLWRAMLDKRRSVERAIEQARPDLLLVHQTGSDVPLLARRAGFRGRSVLIHHSTGLSPFVTSYDHVVFVSGEQRSSALSRYPALEAGSSIIRYFAGAEYFRSINPLPRSEIVFIGLLDSRRKGLDLLLRAYLETPALRDVTLHVIGDGPLRGGFERESKQANLPLVFHGRIAHAENARLLARAGAYVMPSRGEGLALAYLEALCMGVPIIGYPPNVRELAALLGCPVGTAFQADVDPVSRLAEDILQFTRSDSSCRAAERETLASAARRLFSLETFHGNYREFFRMIEENPS